MNTQTQLPMDDLPTCDICFGTPLADVIVWSGEGEFPPLREMYLVWDEDGSLTVCDHCTERQMNPQIGVTGWSG